MTEKMVTTSARAITTVDDIQCRATKEPKTYTNTEKPEEREIGTHSDRKAHEQRKIVV